MKIFTLSLMLLMITSFDLQAKKDRAPDSVRNMEAYCYDIDEGAEPYYSFHVKVVKGKADLGVTKSQCAFCEEVQRKPVYKIDGNIFPLKQSKNRKEGFQAEWADGDGGVLTFRPIFRKYAFASVKFPEGFHDLEISEGKRFSLFCEIQR